MYNRTYSAADRPGDEMWGQLVKVLLVDPYYLAGNSPPSWVLGQMETILLRAGHEVEVSDFCDSLSRFDTLQDFRKRENQFVDEVVAAGGRADIVYITTSFGIPQKPTPIFARVRRIVDGLNEAASGVPVVVGGAQIEYLTVHDTNPGTILQCPNIVAFACSDEAFPAYLNRSHSLLLTSSGKDNVWLRGDQGSFMLASLPPSTTEAWPVPTTWRSWHENRYPRYRAVLTSIGCRYGCTFCFESNKPSGRSDSLIHSRHISRWECGTLRSRTRQCSAPIERSV